MSKQGGKGEILRALGLLTQLGLAMAVCVIIGVLAGRFLDQKLGTGPVLLIVCSLIGGAASFKVLYDYTVKYWKQ